MAPLSTGCDFDPVAGVYDSLARLVFGSRLQIAQACWLEKIPPRCEIAIIGGGTGSILKALAAVDRQPRAIHYVEASQQMIDRAGKRLSKLAEQHPHGKAVADSLRFIHLHAERWQPQLAVDVLITPFFLDCFEGVQLEQIVSHLSRCLKPGGHWLITDFARSPHRRHRLMIALMYRFFRFSCRLSATQLEPYFDHVSRWGLLPTAERDFATLSGPVRSVLMKKEPAQSGIPACRENVIAHV